MSKRFIVSTDPLTTDQEKALREKLKGGLWWHWLPNFWLVKDVNEIFTASSIRDFVYEVNNTARCIVMEVDQTKWAALTRKDSQGRDMSAWLKTNWE